MPYIFFIVGLVIYLLILTALLIRLMKIKRGMSYANQPSLSSIIEPKVDTLAYHIVVSWKEVLHFGYVSILLLTEKLIKVFKFLIIKVEKRFARIVNQVRGKGEINKKGAVSLFLREIKDHQDKMKAELSNG